MTTYKVVMTKMFVVEADDAESKVINMEEELESKTIDMESEET